MERNHGEQEQTTAEKREALHINTIVIPADHEQPLRQAELPAAGLEERQQLVGGLIQGIDLTDPPARLYCNEEGKVLEQPLNSRATLLLWVHNPAFRYEDFIVGDAFLVGPVGRRRTDTNAPGEYVQRLCEATRFRVEVKVADKWYEHPARFDQWTIAYEHALDWSTDLAGGQRSHGFDIRIVPDQ